MHVHYSHYWNFISGVYISSDIFYIVIPVDICFHFKSNINSNENKWKSCHKTNCNQHIFLLRWLSFIHLHEWTSEFRGTTYWMIYINTFLKIIMIKQTGRPVIWKIFLQFTQLMIFFSLCSKGILVLHDYKKVILKKNHARIEKKIDEKYWKKETGMLVYMKSVNTSVCTCSNTWILTSCDMIAVFRLTVTIQLAA